MPSYDKQTKVQLPKDADSQSIQVLGLTDRASLTASTPAQTRTALPSGSEVVRVSLNVDSYILFGDSSVAATSSNGHFMPAGVEYFRVSTETHLSVVAESDAGVGTISRLT